MKTIEIPENRIIEAIEDKYKLSIKRYKFFRDKSLKQRLRVWQ